MPTETPSQTVLGLRIRTARKAAGLSQVQLSEASGVDQRTISDIETGDVKSPGFDPVAKLARALDIPADDLLEEQAS